MNTRKGWTKLSPARAWEFGAALALAAVLALVAFRYLARERLNAELAAALDSGSRGSLETIRRAIRHGADPDLQSPHYGFTALMAAAAWHDAAFARSLIARGADVNLRDRNGLTALMTAVQANDAPAGAQMVRLLAENGADLNAHATDGATALHMAASGRNVALLRVLIEVGADPWVRDSTRKTPAQRVQDDFYRSRVGLTMEDWRQLKILQALLQRRKPRGPSTRRGK